MLLRQVFLLESCLTPCRKEEHKNEFFYKSSNVVKVDHYIVVLIL